MKQWDVLGAGLITVMGCAGAPPPAAIPKEEQRAAPPAEPARRASPAELATSPAPAAATSKPDDEVCHGLIDEPLQQQLAGRAAKVRFCYERLLSRDPQREGRLMVTVKLSGVGTIDRAWITLDELADPETTECALASFKEPLNGSITGGCAIVNVPLRFKVKKPEPQLAQ
ncbi:MAG TPA: hypothetical protein VHP33_14905 [Polyangiaceae bacterium]|nr:hypothetical protein [Polyangiaceae bacterium]